MSKALDRAMDRARELGNDAGKAAASWVFDGNTSTETYRTFLRWYEDGDPRIDEFAPRSWLSGEWSDEPTTDDVLADIGLYHDDDTGEWSTPAEDRDDILSAYEDAADDAYWTELQRVAILHAEG
jgi:hypothetical protein